MSDPCKKARHWRLRGVASPSAFVYGDKFKREKYRLRAILESDDATSLSLELVNLDHSADTFGHRDFLVYEIADAKLRDALHVYRRLLRPHRK